MRLREFAGTALVVSACGRIDFDLRTDADATVDAGTCAEVGLGEGAFNPNALVATASGFAAMWSRTGETRVVRLDAQQNRVSDRMIGIPMLATAQPSAAAIGDELAVAWEGNPLQVVVQNADGSVLSRPLIASGRPNVASPSLAPLALGGGYMIAWSDERTGTSNVYTNTFTSAGAVLGADAAIGGTSSRIEPAIASRSDGYVYAWIEDAGRNLRIAALDAAGGPLTTARTIGNSAKLPALTPSPNGYGLAWLVDAGALQTIAFAELDPAAQIIGSNSLVLGGTGFYVHVDIAWDSDHYIIIGTFDSTSATAPGDVAYRIYVLPDGTVSEPAAGVGQPGTMGDSHHARAAAGSFGARFSVTERREADGAQQMYVGCL